MPMQDRKSLLGLVVLIFVFVLALGAHGFYAKQHAVSDEFIEETRERVGDDTLVYLGRAYAYEQVADKIREQDASLMRLFFGDHTEFNTRLQALDIPFTSKEDTLRALGYDVEQVKQDLVSYNASLGFRPMDEEDVAELTSEMLFLDSDTFYELSLTTCGLLMVIVENRSYYGVDRGVLFFDLEGNELHTPALFVGANNLNEFLEVDTELARLRQPPSYIVDLALANTRKDVEAAIANESLTEDDILANEKVIFDPLNFINIQTTVNVVIDDLMRKSTDDITAETQLNQSQGLFGLQDFTDIEVLTIAHNYRGVHEHANYTINALVTLQSDKGTDKALIRIACYGSRVVSYTVERVN